MSSISRFLNLETDTAEDDEEEDEVNEHWPSLIDDEEYLAILLDKERDGCRIQSHVDDWIVICRSDAIQWIFNVRSYLQLQFHTAFLSVTYIDRFLTKQRITNDKPWAIQLLAIACLSLAAKMNEPNLRANCVLSSLESEQLQFQKRIIERMELLVLTKLDWRMHSITPFQFIQYFISCLCKQSSSQRRFVSLISLIISAATNDMNVMAHRSSSIAMAATLMAVEEDLSRESMEMKVKTTWVNQLFDHADVYACYSRMLKLEPLKVNIYKGDSSKEKESTKRKRS